MAAILRLPDSKKHKDELLGALDDIINEAILERNILQVGWWITDAFMQGVRQFDVIDYETGEIEISYEAEDGELHLRWDEPLTRIRTEVGRLSRLDTSPKINKRTHSLESLRNASVSQVILDNMMSAHDQESLKTQFFTGLALYGTYGIASWRDILRSDPLSNDFELIPPWELLPIPAGIQNPTDLRGVIRTRLLPLAELEAQARVLGRPLPKATDAEWGIIEMPYGRNISRRNVAGEGLRNAGPSAGTFNELFDEKPRTDKKEGQPSRQKARVGDRNEKFVRLREVWILGPKNTVARYIMRAGDVIIDDQDYILQGIDVPMPIGICRFEDTGHFYGRSLASKIIPLSLELEHLLERLIQNMADLDRFGFILVPNGIGVDYENFKPTTAGPKIVPYEPDLANQGLLPTNISPVNTSDVPGRIMQFGVNLLDRIVSQGPLFGGVAPGRADSGEAFSVLAETGSTHLIPLAASIESSYSTVYRSMLFDVSDRFRNGESVDNGLELTRIENSIAGVTLDPTTGRLKLDAGLLPDPWSIDVGIRSRDMESRERRRQEAQQLLSEGLLTPLEFIIMNYKEDWNFPVGNRGVWENYVKAVMWNLILFNDGISPGETPFKSTFNIHIDKPEIFLMAIEDFVAGAEFALASIPVQTVFTERIIELRSRLGQTLPQGLPTPDLAATQSAQLQPTQPQLGPQQG